MSSASGLLLLDKPSGPTSHDMVAAVRRGAGLKRVGHAGTLDPLATGVLVLLLGPATRLSEYLTDKDKRYLARVRFGQTTNTYDAAGEVTRDSGQVPDREAVEHTLAQFRGPQQQRPPAYSAIKREGQKAYDLARRGETVELEPRPVTIYSVTLTHWEPPLCELDVHCSAGTYIRSLAYDLGEALGCGAHLAALRRTASGEFHIDNAVTLPILQQAFADEDWQRYLLPPDAGLRDWPAITLTEATARAVRHGNAIPMDAAMAPPEWGRAYAPSGEFVAILHAHPARHQWQPHKVLVME
jgi:tRNA pseudouridine55 synthase